MPLTSSSKTEKSSSKSGQSSSNYKKSSSIFRAGTTVELLADESSSTVYGSGMR